jgi:hypothetical protein
MFGSGSGISDEKNVRIRIWYNKNTGSTTLKEPHLFGGTGGGGGSGSEHDLHNISRFLKFKIHTNFTTYN